jgi:hypothetical protein
MTELEKEFSAKIFLNEMRDLQRKYGDNPDILHYNADMTMCELLEKLGYSEGVEIFMNMEKWYS